MIILTKKYVIDILGRKGIRCTEKRIENIVVIVEENIKSGLKRRICEEVLLVSKFLTEF